MGQIQAGEIIPALGQKLEQKIEKIINKNKHRGTYYIMVTANWFADGTQLRMVVSPREKKPPKMLNTMCWRMNNRTGELKELWVLPLDAPIEPIDTAPIIESIAKQSENIPIVY